MFVPIKALRAATVAARCIGITIGDPVVMDAGNTCISIIVPTYKEAENIRLLAGRVFATLHAGGLEGEMIIVDDASGDATPDVVAELARARRCA